MYDYCLFEQVTYLENDRFLYAMFIAIVSTFYFVSQVFKFSYQSEFPIINEMQSFIDQLNEKSIKECYIDAQILTNKFKMYVYDRMI